LNFLDGLSKTNLTYNFTKMCLVAAELFPADGRTDRYDEANSRLPQFRESH